MKRLVVCCDGTWQAESSSTVSNIVKIAQTVCVTAPGPHGAVIPQWVSYVSGPGARGFLTDRMVGGAFGLGLEANLSSAYWHLALNWEPGDEIYIFGFSRGAFTARSLAGLISRIGLLTPAAMIDGRYPDALALYRQPPPVDGSTPPSWERFRAEHCRHPARIDFLGVFDTVGALGVPGLTALRHRFHDVRLSPNVHRARQALAIDERRRAFEPCLWEVPVEPEVKYRRDVARVKQVWFAGVHTDIGGGYPECGLSDLTLRWMVREAADAGLVFDRDRLDTLARRCPRTPEVHLTRHDSLRPAYRALNLLRTLRAPRSERFHLDSWRRLAPRRRGGADSGVKLASAVLSTPGYHPPNLERWRADTFGGSFPEDLFEDIDSVPAQEAAAPDIPAPDFQAPVAPAHEVAALDIPAHEGRGHRLPGP